MIHHGRPGELQCIRVDATRVATGADHRQPDGQRLTKIERDAHHGADGFGLLLIVARVAALQAGRQRNTRSTAISKAELAELASAHNGRTLQGWNFPRV